MRLNLGCGRVGRKGWINVDRVMTLGVDVIADLDACASTPLPFDDDAAQVLLLSHVMEHLHHPLPLMQELHRIARPDAVLIARVPYGSSDAADEDPTHVRRFFANSFAYYAQPTYWRADYGYRGDWQASKVILHVPPELASEPKEALWDRVLRERNVVIEMVVVMRPVKPARAPSRRLEVPTGIAFVTETVDDERLIDDTLGKEGR